MVIYDDCLAISIYELTKAGCLRLGYDTECSFLLRSQNGQKHSVLLKVNTKNDAPGIVISGVGNNASYYPIPLFCKPFNLNKGVIWYFICPVTGATSCKLWLHNGQFCHRKAIKGMYRKQTYSHCYRPLANDIENLQKLSGMITKVNTPYFRKTYAGKPTKPYLKIVKQITLNTV